MIISEHVMIGMLNFVPHLKALGVRYVEHGDNWVMLKLPYAQKLIGFPDTGVIAGGAIYSMMDNASGMAIMCASKAFSNLATVDLRIDYLKPATVARDILCRVECYKQTRSVSFVRGVAYHDDPTNPIAHSIGTFMLSASISSPIKKAIL
jgi:uncharacterized protein (TIGR00369 family)